MHVVCERHLHTQSCIVRTVHHVAIAPRVVPYGDSAVQECRIVFPPGRSNNLLSPRARVRLRMRAGGGIPVGRRGHSAACHLRGCHWQLPRARERDHDTGRLHPASHGQVLESRAAERSDLGEAANRLQAEHAGPRHGLSGGHQPMARIVRTRVCKQWCVALSSLPLHVWHTCYMSGLAFSNRCHRLQMHVRLDHSQYSLSSRNQRCFCPHSELEYGDATQVRCSRWCRPVLCSGARRWSRST